MKNLVDKLVKEGVLKTSRVIKSFLANDRKYFIPAEMQSQAYVDAPLPLGAGQTISQPYTVAFMLELLEPKPGDKILDVGFGSGWTTALLAYIVGEEGKVYGLEIVPELFEHGQENLKKHYSILRGSLPLPSSLSDIGEGWGEVTSEGVKIKNITLLNKTGWEGLPEQAPFDRILVSAAASEVPQALKDQLIMGGRMVIPVGGKSVEDFESWTSRPFYSQSIKLIKKTGKDKFEEDDYPGFVFVPLVKK